MYHTESKTRSAGQILEKPFVYHGGHIFSPILLNDGQNACLADISDKEKKKKTGHVLSKTRSQGQIFK